MVSFFFFFLLKKFFLFFFLEFGRKCCEVTSVEIIAAGREIGYFLFTFFCVVLLNVVFDVVWFLLFVLCFSWCSKKRHSLRPLSDRHR